MNKLIFIGSFSSLRCYPLEIHLKNNPEIVIMGPINVIKHFDTYSNIKIILPTNFLVRSLLKIIYVLNLFSSPIVDTKFYNLLRLVRKYKVSNYYNTRLFLFSIAKFLNGRYKYIISKIIDCLSLFLLNQIPIKCYPDNFFSSNYADIYGQVIGRALCLNNSLLINTAIVHSWDNTYTKAINLVSYTNLLVWGAKQELDISNSYHYKKSNIYSIGVPGLNFNYNIKKNELFTITIFLSNIKIFKNQYIYISTYIRNLIKIIGYDVLCKKLSIVIRPHPGDTLDASLFNHLEFVKVDEPSVEYMNAMSFDSFKFVFKQKLFTEFDNASINIFKSDLIITGASTIALQAILLKKPMINLPSYYASNNSHFKSNFFYFFPHIKFLLINKFLNRYFDPLDAAIHTKKIFDGIIDMSNEQYYLNYNNIYKYYHKMDCKNVIKLFNKIF